MNTIKYSCPECGLRDVEVKVPFRRSDHDVAEWMNELCVILSRDHDERSPQCHPEQLADIKIPTPEGTQWVGGPPVH